MGEKAVEKKQRKIGCGKMIIDKCIMINEAGTGKKSV